jgi:Bacterial Ig-like domain
MVLTRAPIRCTAVSSRVLALVLLALAFALYATVPAGAQEPLLTIESPPNGVVSANSTPSFSGATDDSEDEVVLSIYTGSLPLGLPVQTLTALPLLEKWSVGPAATLPDGTYTAQASQTNLLTLELGRSSPVTFTVDTSPPAVTLTPPATITNSSTVSLSGGAGVAVGDSSTVRVKIYAGEVASGTPLETVETTSTGATWEIGPLPPLADGVYTVQAEQSDEAGNVGLSAAATFTVDTVAPGVSLASVPTPTNDSTPSFTGVAGVAAGDLAAVRLKIYAGLNATGSPLRTLDAGLVGGAWSVGPIASLPDGTYTAQAEQSDRAGNTGFSATSTFKIDTVAPVVSLTAVPTPTNDATPSFTGKAGVAPGDNAAVRVKVYSGSTASGTPVQTLEVTPASGTWSAGPVSALADGVYTVQAEQSDQAGNIGLSVAAKFKIDATPPDIALSSPLDGVSTNGNSEFVAGTAGTSAGDLQSITIDLFTGSTPDAQALSEQIGVQASSGHWSVTFGGLSEGTYTVRAEQRDSVGNVGQSLPATFTVDQIAPIVSLAPVSSPSTSTPKFSGSAGVAPGDIASVTLKIYAGSLVSGTPALALEVPSSAGAWSAGPVSALSPGAYIAQAEQSDHAGNIGKSKTVKFTVEASTPVTTTETTTETKTTPPPAETPAVAHEPAHSPPVASFTWFPSAPHTGETVSVVSNSTDPSSPIATLAWALAANPFQNGGSVFTTSFATPGEHAVSLRVLALDGLWTIATAKIPVSSPPASLMQPFPIVRIAGNDTAKGARLTLLTVQAPAGAKITVRCRGGGCPGKAETRVAASRTAGVALIEFHRFERSLRAGAVLEIRVSKPGQIGKYTRFRVRRGRLPERSDACLSPEGTKPMGCPSK